ncbi:putative short-chain dehydrogenase/reductase [Nocardiopsis terrae]|uniref:NAD(P)-dependent dehydrogenase (Short-subunit alcohol dehydrogenase family) n=1 Tax=Nocardiopsis terrae TaxID=372655 RepID=A0ABR9HAW5_9ACTN|nr:oxidoreductase [Nocardiopsis terrae]MBE1456171.1 NAD(P)-dependent dehydrogenase (short-subunit alcohol dehydrogenase family) [Nocardiopsis terrae]GHC97987.1 putative short-chain dehydrogenase/reductase [Nocardiopsis terrae]
MSENNVSLPDLTGRTAVVTGANSGLGLETAKVLAGRGARVVLAVRDTGKGEEAARQIRGETEVRRLDLADLASVREFADGWKGDLHLLINNAGLMAIPESRTRDGFETQFGVNHLGHFALTNLLLEHVTGRVVTLSSGLHRAVRGIHFADVNLEGRYTPYRAYGQSKLANLLFTLELQRRLDEVGSQVLATAAHPGYAATNLQSRSGKPFLDRLMRISNRVLAQSAAAGALPTVYAATQDVPGAAFAGPTGLFVNGAPGPSSRSAAAQDPAAARRLWDLSEEMTGTSFPL